MIDSGIDNFLWAHLLINGLSLIIGLHLIFNPPKNLDTSTDFNLSISKAKLNMDTWTELHAYSGKMFVMCAIVFFLLGTRQ
ncbi:MAG: hypothetical protein AB8G86_20510 [Saprospiraceae bacterium]